MGIGSVTALGVEALLPAETVEVGATSLTGLVVFFSNFLNGYCITWLVASAGTTHEFLIFMRQLMI